MFIIHKILNNKYLFLILFSAFLLRFIGTNPGFSPYHTDEPAIYGTTLEMVKNSTIDPGRYDYPAPVMYINLIFYKFVFIPFFWIKFYLIHFWGLIDGIIKIPPNPEDIKRIFTLEIAGERGVNAMFWSRYITALFSLGNVYLLYILGKKLFNKEVGLIAALFLAFNFRHVLNAHITLPDIYNSFFLLLSLIANINLWKNPSRKNYLISGILTGLSFSVKYQFQAFLPLVIVHLYLSFNKWKFDIRKFFNPAVFVAFFSIPVIFILTNPFYLINFEQAQKSNLDDFRKYGIGTNVLNLFPTSYIYHIDFGPPLFFLTIIGVILMVKEKQKLVFLISSLAFFFFIFGYYSTGGFYIRNIIPATPPLLLFASFAFFKFYKIVLIKLPKFSKNIIMCLLLIFLVFIPAKNSIINSFSNTQSWNYSKMAKWLNENLKQDVVLAATPFDVPKGPKVKKTEFELDGNFSLAEHNEAGAEYALMNLDWAVGNFYFWMHIDLDHLSYLNKPLNILRNTFHGLSIEETIRYQVHSETKPWQAPDANLILAKIPNWRDTLSNQIKSFNFNKDLDGWKIISERFDTLPDFTFDSNMGGASYGSIMLLPAGYKYPFFRISSPAIEVKEGYLYRITGKIKTEIELKPKERDGFYRVDFYKSLDDVYGVGMTSSVSSRIYGKSSWTEKQIIDIAPKGAKFLTVSFQVSSASQTKMWIDDVLIFESYGEVTDITKEQPYNIRPIDLDIIYPFSQGNL